jgi:hypothetical protein
MWFGRMHVLAVRGGNEDRAAGVSPLTNEEPLIGMESGIDIVWEVIGKDCCDSSDCMIGERETSLCCSRRWFSGEGSSSTKNGDVSRDRGVGNHRGLEVLPSRSGNIDVVRVDSDIIMERGEKKGVKHFLSYTGGCRRHGR